MALIFTIVVIAVWIALIAALNIVLVRNLVLSSIISGAIFAVFMAIGLEEHMGRMWSGEYFENVSIGFAVYFVYALAIGFVSKWLYVRFTNHLKKTVGPNSST